MKKIIITLFLVLGVLSNSKAQQNHREKIQAYKTAYITQELDLSPQEAEKFWPIYNAYEKKMFNAKVLKVREERNKIAEKGGLESLTDKEAKEVLSHLIQYEKEVIKIKEALFKELDGILSPVKLLKLHKAEWDFNKKLLSEYRKNRGPNR